MDGLSVKRTIMEGNIRYRSKSMFALSELIFYCALIVNIAYSVFYPVYVALHEYYHYLVFIFMLLILACRKELKYSEAKIIGVIAFIALNTVMLLINHSGLGVLILIIWPLSIIYVFQNNCFPSGYIRKINILMMVGWILSVLASLSYTDTYFENFERNIEQVGINPNTIAIIIAITCLFLGLYIDGRSKSKIWKIFVYLVSFAALYRTRSRASFFAFVAVLIMELFLKRRVKLSKKWGLLLTALVIATGIIFPFVYVGLYMNGTVTYDTLILGKRLFTGRQYIWINLWNYLQENHGAFFWGVGYNTELYSRGTFNLHNAYLMIFAQYGILTLLVYLAYIFHSVALMYGKSGQISGLQFKCYQILLYVLIVGFGETVLSYLPNLIFIAMAIGIGCGEKLEVV